MLIFIEVVGVVWYFNVDVNVVICWYYFEYDVENIEVDGICYEVVCIDGNDD